LKITEVAVDELGDLADLCARELVLDRYADSIPDILARRPRICLVARRDATVVGCCVGSTGQDASDSAEGFIDLLVVASAERRRGLGRLLADTMEQRFGALGCTRINLAGSAPFYAWPGIDVHYTAAICFAEDLGYRRAGVAANMDIDLVNTSLDTDSSERRLTAAGIQVRRAGSGDDGPMQASLAATWMRTWVVEATAALRGSQSGVYVAVQGSRYVGFCTYGVGRPHEIGPLGTAPDMRRLGIGAVLLKRCLAEQRERGVPTAELVWVGPLSYYARTVNATIGRTFWLYEKAVGEVRGPDWRDRIGLIN
jgi:mycothiol synthase